MNFVPPEARIEVVKDDYFGTTIEDPYRWLENWKGAEAQEWVKAQAAYSEEVLKALPERDSLLKRISELSDAGPVLNSFKISAGRYFISAGIREKIFLNWLYELILLRLKKS